MAPFAEINSLSLSPIPSLPRLLPLPPPTLPPPLYIHIHTFTHISEKKATFSVSLPHSDVGLGKEEME